MQPLPSIALISSSQQAPPLTHWYLYQNAAELLTGAPVDIVILDQTSGQAMLSLATLRAHSLYRFAPIYTAASQNASHHSLSDGPAPLLEEDMLATHAKIVQRLRTFNQGRAPESLEELIMAWLWSRPQAKLEAARDTSTPKMYRYPLIDAFAQDHPVDENIWLGFMSKRGWLEAETLVDRTRQCSGCHSARLNYVDTCPSCKALDIARQPALHCFTCGHVAPQQNFLKDGMMRCPNCLTQLRHIGSDYDRPLENMSCKACDHFFIDADVQARCLDCDQAHRPDELLIREVRHYSLTPSARLRCRQGLTDEAHNDYFGRLNLLSLSTFSALVEWQMQQARRYTDTPKCSLLGLRFHNLDIILDSTEGQVDSLIERIKTAIRDTDRCSRSREDLLWLLLPHTDHDGAEALWARLNHLTQLVETDTQQHLDVRMAYLTLPDDLLNQEDAALLMGRLAGAIS
jgi:hypothetical protein